MTTKKDKRLRVGLGSDNSQIMCGHTDKDGVKWLANSNECTSDVLATLYAYVMARGGAVIVKRGEQPAFMISVTDLTPPEPVAH